MFLVYSISYKNCIHKKIVNHFKYLWIQIFTLSVSFFFFFVLPLSFVYKVLVFFIQNQILTCPQWVKIWFCIKQRNLPQVSFASVHLFTDLFVSLSYTPEIAYNNLFIKLTSDDLFAFLLRWNLTKVLSVLVLGGRVIVNVQDKNYLIPPALPFSTLGNSYQRTVLTPPLSMQLGGIAWTPGYVS